jgi:glycopeptide antibiotics resistance protein
MLKENILNCILLMPYGCLLPGALDKRISWKRGLVIGMGTSFVIELLQLITCRGLFEFDDIIHNGVGCMMGAVLGSWCWLRMLKKFKMLRKPHAS